MSKGCFGFAGDSWKDLNCVIWTEHRDKNRLALWQSETGTNSTNIEHP